MMKAFGALMLALCVLPPRTATAFLSVTMATSRANKSKLAAYRDYAVDSRPSWMDRKPYSYGPRSSAANRRGVGDVMEPRRYRERHSSSYGNMHNNRQGGSRETRRSREPYNNYSEGPFVEMYNGNGYVRPYEYQGETQVGGVETSDEWRDRNSNGGVVEELYGDDGHRSPYSYEPTYSDGRPVEGLYSDGYYTGPHDGYRSPYEGETRAEGVWSDRERMESGVDLDGRPVEELHRENPYSGIHQGVWSHQKRMQSAGSVEMQSDGRPVEKLHGEDGHTSPFFAWSQEKKMELAASADSHGRYDEGLDREHGYRSPHQGERQGVGAATSNMWSGRERMQSGGRAVSDRPVERVYSEDGSRRHHQGETWGGGGTRTGRDGYFDAEGRYIEGSGRQYRDETPGRTAMRSNEWNEREGMQSSGRVAGPRRMPGDLEVDGGAVRSFRVHRSVPRVRVTLLSNGVPIRAAVELWRVAGDSKQIIAEVNGDDGDYVPYSEVIETPRSGCTIAVRNMGSVEHPLTARVEPLYDDRYY